MGLFLVSKRYVRSFYFKIIVLMVFIFSSHGYAQAGLVLDQSNPVVLDGSLLSASVCSSSGGTFSCDIAQTFTVGVSGQLQMVQLFAQNQSSSGGFIFDIRQTVSGIPVENNNAVLAQSIIPWYDFVQDATGHVSFDLSSSNLQVIAGDVFAFVLRGYGGGNANINGNIDDPYDGGRAFTRYPNNSPPFNNWGFGLTSDSDFGFRTYVDSSVSVPEPSTMLLLGSGLAGLVGFSRRRLKK